MSTDLFIPFLNSFGLEGFYTGVNFIQGGIVALVWKFWSMIFDLVALGIKFVLIKLHILAVTTAVIETTEDKTNA